MNNVKVIAEKYEFMRKETGGDFHSNDDKLLQECNCWQICDGWRGLCQCKGIKTRLGA